MLDGSASGGGKRNPSNVIDVALIQSLVRRGEVDDLVGAMVYLASEASDFTTGHDIVIDGGYTVW